MPDGDGNLVVEGARLIFKNFSGAKGRYNAEGDRNFSLILDDETATVLERDGWNIKRKPPREEGDDPLIHLPVAVGYGKGRPPTIYLVTSKGRRRLGEEEVMLLDYLTEIKNIDVMVRPYTWNRDGRSGVKAYLKELFVTVNESILERKYADVPEITVGPNPDPEPDKDYIEGEIVSEYEEPRRRAIGR